MAVGSGVARWRDHGCAATAIAAGEEKAASRSTRAGAKKADAKASEAPSPVNQALATTLSGIAQGLRNTG